MCTCLLFLKLKHFLTGQKLQIIINWQPNNELSYFICMTMWNLKNGVTKFFKKEKYMQFSRWCQFPNDECLSGFRFSVLYRKPISKKVRHWVRTNNKFDWAMPQPTAVTKNIANLSTKLCCMGINEKYLYYVN